MKCPSPTGTVAQEPLPDWKVLLEPFQSLFTQPGFRYFCAFVQVFAHLDRRLWVTQVILAGLVDRHFTSFYRFLREGAWSVEAVCQTLWTLCASRCLWKGRLFAAVDDTVCAKQGRHFAGLGWHHDPMSPHPKQHSHGHCFVCLAVLAQQGKGHCVALFVAAALYLQKKACSTEQTFSTKLELAAGLLANLSSPPGVVALAVADGAYAKKPFVKPARAAGWQVLSRLRSDTVFYDLPPAPVLGQKGRPRKYGQKHKAQEWAQEQTEWQCVPLRLYGKPTQVQIKTRVVLQRRLDIAMRLVAVRWGKHPLVFLFSTDTGLSALEILQAYCSRFAIETGFRDAKQSFGLSTYQVRSRAGIERIVHLCLWAQTLLRLRLWNQRPGQTCCASVVSGAWAKPLSYLTLSQQKKLSEAQDRYLDIFDTSGPVAQEDENPRVLRKAA